MVQLSPQGLTLDVKLADMRLNGLHCWFKSVIRRGQLNSGESCIMLQSGPNRSLIKFPQHSVLACSTWILCCRGSTLQTWPRTGVCKPLMPGVVSPKVHQNNCSYVSSVDVPSDSLHKNLAWWAFTWRTLKNHKTVKIGRWALAIQQHGDHIVLVLSAQH